MTSHHNTAIGANSLELKERYDIIGDEWYILGRRSCLGVSERARLGTHTGVVVLYCGFDEQARHDHMSDEYKDRNIIIALLKTPPRYYRQ